MFYKKITIRIPEGDTRDMIMALLSDGGFEGFEEKDDALLAFAKQEKYNDEEIAALLKPWEIVYETEEVAKMNWNKEWEENFQPVIIENFCTVRADFHQIKVDTPHEIVITPKMSFGTGHHATTQLMMRLMQGMDFKHKSVLDFGTGTGILAILASMLGAKNVLAIDNDEWCYENSKENVLRNAREGIEVKAGSLEIIGTNSFDVLLANINRHILLEYMNMMYAATNKDGFLLLSGILIEDRPVILQSAIEAGFIFSTEKSQSNWLAMLFKK